MQSVCSVLLDAADRSPQKPLFIFPENRWCAESRLTYADLADRAGSAATAIAEHAAAGDRALLLLPAGADFWAAFFGCLFRGVIAVPLMIPNFNRPSALLEEVCRTCEPALLIIDDSSAGLLNRRSEQHRQLSGLPRLTPNAWNGLKAAGHYLPDREQQTAFLQFTSGSTARPRGIRISHGNLAANLAMIRECMGVRTAEDRGVTWLPHYHDMGLIGSYLSTLFTENTSWCLRPEDFVLDPVRWLHLISQHRASVCGAPNFAWRMLLDKATDEQIAALDLSTWRVAYTGAEKIREETLRRFQTRFRSCGFRSSAFFPCYGLGEATLLVSGGPPDAEPVIREVSTMAMMQGRIEEPVCAADASRLVGCGTICSPNKVMIVRPGSAEPAEEGCIGEVLIAGPSVTDGYFHGEADSAPLFQHIELNGTMHRFLRTGDLGFLADSQLLITGRIRELIIIRGRNLFPEDIEQTCASAVDRIQPDACVAFSAERDGEEVLIVCCEMRRQAIPLDDPESLINTMRQAIATRFGVQPHHIFLLRPASLPRTSSGKLKRVETRQLVEAGELQPLFPV